MKDNQEMIDPLFERVEEYSRTSFELMRLKLINKVSEVLSMMIVHFLLIVVFSFFIISLNIAAGFWLGGILQNIPLGFLLVAGFYALVFIILFSLPSLRRKVYQNVLSNILD